MNETINYYNSKADEFYNSTVDAKMNAQYNMFEKYLYPGGCILDCGCGSGRDTKYFLEQGYEVIAIDGSDELCKKARELTGIDVKNMYFQDINFESQFDGVWACASLLHVPKEELAGVLDRIKTAIVPKGILYISFKYGEFVGERNGRFFTDLTEEEFNEIIASVGGFKVQETHVSRDVRPGRVNEKWLNSIVIKDKEMSRGRKNGIVEIEETRRQNYN